MQFYAKRNSQKSNKIARETFKENPLVCEPRTTVYLQYLKIQEQLAKYSLIKFENDTLVIELLILTEACNN